MLQLALHFMDEPKQSKDKQSKKNVSVSCPRLEHKLFTNERIHDAPQRQSLLGGQSRMIPASVVSGSADSTDSETAGEKEIFFINK